MVSSCWLLLSAGAQPTEDVYFLESAVPLLRSEGSNVGRLDVRGWRWQWVRWMLSRQRGANLVICRSLPVRVLYWLEQRREMFGRIVYLIDDDVSAAAEDEMLPIAYRRRMAHITGIQPRLLQLADVVVASSELLATLFKRRHSDVRVLTPPLIAPLPDHSHFDESCCQVGFHGSRAHLIDLQHIAPALRHLHDTSPHVSLEVMLGSHTPAELQVLERLVSPDPRSWEDFRDYQRRRRIHIGLAPLLDSDFNRGKSFIKFLDISAMGGVGIYSRRLPYTEIVEDGITGLLVDDSPQSWYDALRYLIDHPDTARWMAENAARVAKERGDPAHAAAFWDYLDVAD